MARYDHLTKDELARLLEARDRRDATRFGLVWEANEIELDKAINADFVALDFIPELSCPPTPCKAGAPPAGTSPAETESPDKLRQPERLPYSSAKNEFSNLIIEGDNFDALRYLRMTHAGRVKCIYIDPPYNTGNRDFVYNDRFVDANDSLRHSTWCEFMYQRLMLAKDLLRQDGVIFVSIDDNEVFALGMIMQKVFGERNFVANCIWQKRYSSSNDHKSIAPMHEFVLIYQQSELWQRNLLPRGVEKDRQYRFHVEKGNFRPDNYTCNKSAEERPNLYYSIIQPNTGKEIWPKRTRVWSYSKNEHQRHIAEDLILLGQGRQRQSAFV